MTQRIVSKNLAGLEDLLLGKGTVNQERAAQVYPVSRIPLLYPCDSIAERDMLDTDKFQYAVVFDSGIATFYKYTVDTWVSYGATS